jgi:hypothetical protein
LEKILDTFFRMKMSESTQIVLAQEKISAQKEIIDEKNEALLKATNCNVEKMERIVTVMEQMMEKQNKHSEEKEDIRTHLWQEKNARLQDRVNVQEEFEAKRQKFEKNATLRYEQEMSEKMEVFQLKLVQKERKYQQELEIKTKGHLDILKQKNEEHAQVLASKQEEYEQTLAQNIESHNSQMNDMKKQYEEELGRCIDRVKNLIRENILSNALDDEIIETTSVRKHDLVAMAKTYNIPMGTVNTMKSKIFMMMKLERILQINEQSQESEDEVEEVFVQVENID